MIIKILYLPKTNFWLRPWRRTKAHRSRSKDHTVA